MTKSDKCSVVFILMYVLLFIISCVFAPNANAARLHKEREYQDAWCVSGSDGIKGSNPKSEVTLSDRSRVDCLTSSMAYELDFANNWTQAIGQSLFYSAMTGKRAGIVLIIEDAKRDERYIVRLKKTIDEQCLHIDVVYVTPVSLGINN